MGSMKDEMQKVRDLLKADESSPRNQSIIKKGDRNVRVTKRRILSTSPQKPREKKKRSRLQQGDDQHRVRQDLGVKQRADKKHLSTQPPASDRSRLSERAATRPQASATRMSFHPIQHNEDDEHIEFEMPPWNANGIYLSPPATKQGDRILPIRIGLDFGTAYTKVSIQVGEYFLFVDWHGLVGRSAYVLKGHLSLVDKDYRVGLLTSAATSYRDLKLPLLNEEYESADKLVPTTIFLALVITYCRAWLYQQADFMTLAIARRLVWELNIGCPTGSFEDDKLVTAYKQIASAAWYLSTKRAVSWHNARDVLIGTQSLPHNIGLENLSVTPEFVAQIAGIQHRPNTVKTYIS